MPTEHALEKLGRELVAKFTYAELLDLAAALPFDAQAADAHTPTVHGTDRAAFLARTGCHVRPNDPPHRALAAYVAMAAQHARSRVYEELLELTKRKLEAAQRLHAVVRLARERGAELLQAAVRSDTGRGKKHPK